MQVSLADTEADRQLTEKLRVITCFLISVHQILYARILYTVQCT